MAGGRVLFLSLETEPYRFPQTPKWGEILTIDPETYPKWGLPRIGHEEAPHGGHLCTMRGDLHARL